MIAFHFVFFNLEMAERESIYNPLDVFGTPESHETWVAFEDGWRMEDVAVFCNFFPSLSQARKNGWSGPIPEGYTEKTFGKGKKNQTFVGIKNKFPHWDNDYWWSDDNWEHPPTRQIWEWIQQGRP